MEQQENSKRSKPKAGNAKGKGSGINYDDLDDMLNDDLEFMDGKNSKVSKSKGG